VQQSTPSTSLNSADPGYSFSDPVFVLCNGRSGSTLLRFLLDAHPQLACPPETNLPSLCAQLATVWSLIEGAPLSANRGDEPPHIPDAAIAGIRYTMDRMIGSYLQRRGKTRYCDKSLGTARFAELLLRVYPEARFICLYRHPMDVIASGLEACPWGLSGYGFDPYIAANPGNAVHALARFWADNAGTTLAAEEEFPDRTFRVRYEDLVTDAETVAAEVFRFLEAPPAPGISESCFSGERERSGPADYKIWYTSNISSDSVGRGWSIPAGMIAPPVLGAINEMAAKLNYVPIDEGWGTSEPPADLRVPVSDADSSSTASAPDPSAGEVAGGIGADEESKCGPAHSQLLGSRLNAGVSAAGENAASRWKQHGEETFVAVAVSRDSGLSSEHWLVDLRARTVTFATRAAQERSDWDIVGYSDAWDQVVTGKLNLNVAFRTCRLRYCDEDEAGPVASEDRIRILADLLALTNW
jgi:Sulfotransferase family